MRCWPVNREKAVRHQQNLCLRVLSVTLAPPHGHIIRSLKSDVVPNQDPTTKPVDAADRTRPLSGRSLLKSTSVVGAMTMISRVLGLVRDVVFARLFGADWLMDAFNAANKIPNMLRRFFAEGAFSQAFVPVLNEVRERDGHTAVRQLNDAVAGTLGACLFVVTLIGVIAAPLLIIVFAPGFLRDEATIDLAALMLRFTFPYLLFISLTAMAAGILNTYGRFAVPAVTPVILNIVLISFAIFVSPYFDRPTFALALAVLVAGIAQLAFQLPFLYRLRLLPRPRWAWRDSQVRKIFRLMLPAIFGSSIVQINLMIDNIIASLLGESRITWLYYSDRLMEFPLGVFGIALATVVLPSLSRSFGAGDQHGFGATLDWSMRLVLLIAAPAALGLAVLAGPLMVTLFFGGAFTELDVVMTRASLWAFSGGLLAFITIKILAPGFFSRQDTRTPMRIALVALAVNLTMNLLLVWLFVRFEIMATHAALAAATTISAFVNASLLLRGLSRDGVTRWQSGWLLLALRIVVALVALAAFLLWLSPPLAWWLQATVIDRIGLLLQLVGGGVILYFAALAAMGLRPMDFKLAAVADTAE